jgi:hypothetical protein
MVYMYVAFFTKAKLDKLNLKNQLKALAGSYCIKLLLFRKMCA